MGPRGVIAAAAVAVVLLLPSAAAEPRTLDFRGLDAGGDYWFEEGEGSERNAEVVLRPGQEIWINMRNAGTQDHNLRFAGPIDEAVALMPSGHSLAMRFIVPDEEGVYEYWCDPHRELGMSGNFRIEEASSEDAATPAPAAAMGIVLALLWRGGRRREEVAQ